MSTAHTKVSLDERVASGAVSWAEPQADHQGKAVGYWDWAAPPALVAAPFAELGQDASESWRSAAERATRATPRPLDISLTLSERRWLLLVGDLLVVNTALVVAWMIWQDPPFSLALVVPYFKWFATLSLVWYALGSTLDIYDPARAASTTHSLINSMAAALVTGVAYQLIPWFAPPPGRRLFFFGLIGFLVGGVAVWRLAYGRLLSQPTFQRRVLIVGQDATARRLSTELQAAACDEQANPFRGTGYEVVGFLDRLPDGQLWTLDPAYALVRLIRALGADEVLVAESISLSPTLREALLDCREVGIPVTSLSTAYERLTARLPVEYAEQDLSLIVSPPDSPTQRLYQVGKRVTDVMLASVGMLIMGTLIPYVALGNALTSPGPLFFRQQRVKLGGCSFTLLKFRTMAPEAEKACGAVWAAKDDPRVTFLGRWMRPLRIDELPQVLNVLRGEMSIIGPRPERPELVSAISRALPVYRARQSVRPGITGWAQIHYRYGDSVEAARVKLEYDLYYIKHAGFLQDIVILLQTIPTMLRREGY